MTTYRIVRDDGRGGRESLRDELADDGWGPVNFGPNECRYYGGEDALIRANRECLLGRPVWIQQRQPDGNWRDWRKVEVCG